MFSPFNPHLHRLFYSLTQKSFSYYPHKVNEKLHVKIKQIVNKKTNYFKFLRFSIKKCDLKQIVQHTWL